MIIKIPIGGMLAISLGLVATWYDFWDIWGAFGSFVYLCGLVGIWFAAGSVEYDTKE